MSDNRKPVVPSTKGLDEILGRWREEVKGKQRRVFSFEEQADIKLKDLKSRIYTDIDPVDGWEMRQAYYREIGQYDYIDADRKPIRVGETWGGNDVSCFFRQTIRIPESMRGKKAVLQLYLGGDSLLPKPQKKRSNTKHKRLVFGSIRRVVISNETPEGSANRGFRSFFEHNAARLAFRILFCVGYARTHW